MVLIKLSEGAFLMNRKYLFHPIIFIILLLPFTWYTPDLTGLEDFRGFDVLVYENCRIWITYLLCLILQYGAMTIYGYKILVIIGDILFLISLIHFPIAIFGVPLNYYETCISACTRSYDYGFYLAVVIISISILVNVKNFFK